jgi:hypothetical protein
MVLDAIDSHFGFLDKRKPANELGTEISLSAPGETER